jgi:hypothetical protein
MGLLVRFGAAKGDFWPCRSPQQRDDEMTWLEDARRALALATGEKQEGGAG